MKSVLGILGACLMVLGISGAFFGALALVDPVGAQMSNDADPFGVPPSFETVVFQTGMFVCVFLAGCWLCVRASRRG